MAHVHWPDPVLTRHDFWALYPYLLEPGGADRRRRRAESDYRAWLEAPADWSRPVSDAWRLTGDRGDRRATYGRWFHREVQALFFEDAGGVEGKPQVRGSGAARITPKVRWFTYRGGRDNNADPAAGLLDLSRPGRRVGVLRRKGRSRHVLHLFPARYRIELRAFASLTGVIVLVVHFRAAAHAAGDESLRMSDALRLGYYGAFAGSSSQPLVIVPEGFDKSWDERPAVTEEGAPVRWSAVSDEELDSFASLRANDPVLAASGQKPRPGHDLPLTLLRSLLAPVPGLSTYLGSHGRLPAAAHLVLPGAADADADQLSRLEWLAARFQRHPNEAAIDPLRPEDEPRGEFRTVATTAANRLHLTAEGMVAWSQSETEFGGGQWPERVAREYFVTFLVALHQALVLQDVSWRSYTRKDGRRDNEALLERFLDYSTDYDFGTVSHLMNVQRVYAASRDTLGVERLDEEVRAELSAWVESEARQEQRFLNSVAVVALLVGFATAFIGLDLAYFSSDSHVVTLWDEQRPAGLLWFWLPLAIVVSLTLGNRSLRAHVGRVVRLLVRSEPSRKRRD